MKNIEPSQSPGPDPLHKQALARRMGRFSLATLISRVLGYVRDASVAYAFGGEYLTDAFYTAFRTSNLLRRLLGEGALASSFVPVFSAALKNESREDVQKFLSALFSALFSLLVAITLLGIWFTPELTLWIAPGFKDQPDKFAMTVTLTRWLFPFFLFISLAALVTGVLNSLKHFFLSAVAPAMLSVAEITYILAIMPFVTLDKQILGLAASVVAGGALHFLVQIPQLTREKFYLRFRWNWNHPHSLQVARLMVPAVIGLSVDQINAFVDTVCATFLVKGSVTALYNSNRLMQLPLALFGISIASVSLPAMSDHHADKNYDRLQETIGTSLRMIVFTVLPASVGLIFLARPIVSLLFEHGRFSSQAALLTSQALQGYCLGLIGYSSVKLLANAFYSLQIPKHPVRVAITCMALNLALILLLMYRLGVGGLALATSISSLVNASWLYVLLRRHLRDKCSPETLSTEQKKLAQTFYKSAAACALMALFLFWLNGLDLGYVAKVLLGVPGGALLFMAGAWLLRIREQKLVLHMIGLRDAFEDD